MNGREMAGFFMNGTKLLLVPIILLLLLVPLLRLTAEHLGIMNEEPALKGNIVYQNKPLLTFRSIYFQDHDSVEKYINENIGFHNFLVRLRNQIDFSLFSVSTGPVIIGKEDYLFLSNYIREISGQSFKGNIYWNNLAGKIKSVQDSLEKRNIVFFVVLVPGKASFFREYIPVRFFPTEIKPTNYQVLVKLMQNKGIRFLDFNPVISKKKDNTEYPLFGKVGTHWSAYCEAIVFDSIVNYMETRLQKTLVNVGIKEVTCSNQLNDKDKDLENVLNLLNPIETGKMPYPVYQYTGSSNAFKPRVITIADSYYSQLHELNIPGNVYGKDLYWFYFNKDYSQTKIPENEFRDELMNADVVMVLATESNYHRLGYGFFDRAYQFFGNKQNIKVNKQPD